MLILGKTLSHVILQRETIAMIMRLYEDVYVNLPRNAAARRLILMYSWDEANLQPFDLVFFVYSRETNLFIYLA